MAALSTSELVIGPVEVATVEHSMSIVNGSVLHFADIK